MLLMMLYHIFISVFLGTHVLQSQAILPSKSQKYFTRLEKISKKESSQRPHPQFTNSWIGCFPMELVEIANKNQIHIETRYNLTEQSEIRLAYPYPWSRFIYIYIWI